MYLPINVSNTKPAPPNTNAAPPTVPPVLHFYHRTSVTSLRSYNHTSAITSLRSFHRISAVVFHCSEAMIDTIEFPILYINGVEPRNKGYGGLQGEAVVQVTTTTLMNDYRDWIENDCIRRGQPLNVPYTPRTDTENYELARSVTNKWNRQYGDKKMLSENIIVALIHCISLDNVRNAATKAKRRLALQTAENQQCESHPSADLYSGERCINHRCRCCCPNYRNACCRTAAGSDSSPDQLFPIPPVIATPPVVAPLPVIAPSPVIATLPVVAPSPGIATPSIVSPPPVVTARLVVATPAVGNSTPRTNPERGQAFIGPSSESFSITRAHSYVQLLGMIQGRLPFAEDDILMIFTDTATTSWKAHDSEVSVRVRDDNDTAKVYFKVAEPDESQSGTENEEDESQIDPNVTLVCLLMLRGEAPAIGHLVEKTIRRLTPRSWLISNTKNSYYCIYA
ncbi:hypothetical protein BDD12DRAFT_923074 [Trichophaea hybrida]|nr:hypothetical protein BDD12DRAFT_923074 [Trichophaea hybrida]